MKMRSILARAPCGYGYCEAAFTPVRSSTAQRTLSAALILIERIQSNILFQPSTVLNIESSFPRTPVCYCHTTILQSANINQ